MRIWGCGMTVLRGAVIGVALLTGASGMVCEGQMSQQPLPSSGRNSTGLPSIDGRKPGEPDPCRQRFSSSRHERGITIGRRRWCKIRISWFRWWPDLKEQVEKSQKDMSTNDAAKKAEEIEKLAKSVRDRMKD